MGPDEMRRIADWILESLNHPEDETVHERIRQEVCELGDQFPVPSDACDSMVRG